MLKRNELYTPGKKNRMKLKCLPVTEINQSSRATCYMIPTVQHSGKDENMETIKGSVVVSS